MRLILALEDKFGTHKALFESIAKQLPEGFSLKVSTPSDRNNCDIAAKADAILGTVVTRS